MMCAEYFKLRKTMMCAEFLNEVKLYDVCRIFKRGKTV
jgi:hypothetical protein